MYKLMIGALLLAVLGLFVIKDPSGRPFLSFEYLAPLAGWLKGLPEEPVVPVGQPAMKRVYTWKDDQGVTQFSDREQDAAGATVLELNGIVNTMPAPPPAQSEAERPALQAQSKPAGMPVELDLEGAMETIEQAQQLQQTLDARKAEIDRLTGAEY